eukprot:2021809-Pleurochrysis_carterae.AAC.1
MAASRSDSRLLRASPHWARPNTAPVPHALGANSLRHGLSAAALRDDLCRPASAAALPQVRTRNQAVGTSPTGAVGSCRCVKLTHAALLSLPPSLTRALFRALALSFFLSLSRSLACSLARYNDTHT